MKVFEYNRENAVNYAVLWAMGRNPKYYDFEEIGGDCTNFISQCLYAGSSKMNHPKWYYYSLNSRSPSWNGVEFLHDFLVNNKGYGPFGEPCSMEELEVGDIIQLVNTKAIFSHSLIVTSIGKVPSFENIIVCAHTYDALNRPLYTYEFVKMRFVKILGVRK